MTITTFWFVRHGFSCGNRAAMMSFPQRIGDPGLTEYGFLTSASIPSIPIEGTIDYVFSSCLSRAIQTAYCMFVRNGLYTGPIIAAPYLREIGISPENEPDRNQDVTRLGPPVSRCVLKHPLAYDCGNGRSRGLDHFMKWFFETFAPSKDMNVVVVTHGGRMRQDLGLSHWPKNNEIVRVTVRKGRVLNTPRVVFSGVNPPTRLDLDSCPYR